MLYMGPSDSKRKLMSGGFLENFKVATENPLKQSQTGNNRVQIIFVDLAQVIDMFQGDIYQKS